MTYWKTRENPNAAKGMEEERIRFDADYISSNTKGESPIFELGPGTGRTFLAYEPGRKICTLDITDRYSEQLKAVAAQRHIELSEHFLNDAFSVFPFADDYFEYGVCFQVFIHQPPEIFEHSFLELSRICRKLVFSVGIHANSPLSPQPRGEHVFAHDYLAAVEKAGLMFTNMVFRGGRIYGVVENQQDRFQSASKK